MSRGKSFRAPWPDSVSRPVVSPLQPSVVYASRDPDALDRQYEGGETGYTYAREGHPNAEVLAGLLDGLERAEGGIVTGSGMAAVTVALLANLKAGDHVIGADQLYGRSLRLMTEDLPRFGIETSLVDPTDAARVAAAVRPERRTRAAWVPMHYWRWITPSRHPRSFSHLAWVRISSSSR